MNQVAASSQLPHNEREEARLSSAKRAIQAGRDAACMYRSNAQYVVKARRMAELIIEDQCVPQLYVLAFDAFNELMSPNVSAYFDLVTSKIVVNVWN